jgi:release factor glutamine methyltransferase
MDKFYGPEEDTYFMIESLKSYFKNHTVKNSLEIGVGNGQVSKLISEYSQNHIGVDINPYAIEETKRVCDKGDYFKSNLFQSVKGKFDLIVFNPPYLPESKDDPEGWIKKAIVGGKKGYEIILDFLEQLPLYLEGDCFLLFTKLSCPDIILKKTEDLLLEKKLVLKKSVMMEEFYVYKITKSEIRISLEKSGYNKIHFFAKGTHGRVFTSLKGKVKYGIKVLNPSSAAKSAIINESEKLKFVNKLGIGPKFKDFNRDLNYLIYTFVDGVPWIKHFETISKTKIRLVILNVLEQCYVMDKAGFEKTEMKRPNKNLIISETGKPVLIDFERGIFKERCGNVTQFLQYLLNSKFAHHLKDKYEIEFSKEKILNLSKDYMSSKNDAKCYDAIRIYVSGVFKK